MRCFFSETLFLLGLGQEVGDRRLDNRIFTFLDIFLGHRNLICRIDTEFRMLFVYIQHGRRGETDTPAVGQLGVEGETTTASGAISRSSLHKASCVLSARNRWRRCSNDDSLRPRQDVTSGYARKVRDKGDKVRKSHRALYPSYVGYSRSVSFPPRNEKRCDRRLITCHRHYPGYRRSKPLQSLN